MESNLIKPVDFEATGTDALRLAQFGFAFPPLSVNEWLIPGMTSDKKPTICLSWAASDFKNKVIRAIDAQRRRDSSKAYEWVKQDRYFSLWVVLRKGHATCERMDVTNCNKLIEDAFVSAGVIPDDRWSRDGRQLYGDFAAAGLPDHFTFAVFIRWGFPHPVTAPAKLKAFC